MFLWLKFTKSDFFFWNSFFPLTWSSFQDAIDKDLSTIFMTASLNWSLLSQILCFVIFQLCLAESIANSHVALPLPLYHFFYFFLGKKCDEGGKIYISFTLVPLSHFTFSNSLDLQYLACISAVRRYINLIVSSWSLGGFTGSGIPHIWLPKTKLLPIVWSLCFGLFWMVLMIRCYVEGLFVATFISCITMTNSPNKLDPYE